MSCLLLTDDTLCEAAQSERSRDDHMKSNHPELIQNNKNEESLADLCQIKRKAYWGGDRVLYRRVRRSQIRAETTVKSWKTRFCQWFSVFVVRAVDHHPLQKILPSSWYKQSWQTTSISFLRVWHLLTHHPPQFITNNNIHTSHPPHRTQELRPHSKYTNKKKWK